MPDVYTVRYDINFMLCRDQSNLVHFNFQIAVITTWRSYEFVEFKWRYSLN
jgi:hypothetical protein